MTYKKILDTVAGKVDTEARKIDVAVTYHVIHTFIGELSKLGVTDLFQILGQAFKAYFTKVFRDKK